MKERRKFKDKHKDENSQTNIIHIRTERQSNKMNLDQLLEPTLLIIKNSLNPKEGNTEIYKQRREKGVEDFEDNTCIITRTTSEYPETPKQEIEE